MKLTGAKRGKKVNLVNGFRFITNDNKGRVPGPAPNFCKSEKGDE